MAEAEHFRKSREEGCIEIAGHCFPAAFSAVEAKRVMRLSRAPDVSLLAEVVWHIVRGEMHLAEQQGLIGKMDRQREDSTLPRAILDTLIETQALHRQDHKCMINALNAHLQ